MAGPALRVGIVSDTHGSLSREASARLAGVDHILHAGDVGSAAVLGELEAIAPTTAVRGNMDAGPVVGALPAVADVTLGGVRFLVGHVRGRLTARGAPDGVRVVVTGHTHVAEIESAHGVIFVNPGSASRPPDDALPTIALALVEDGDVTVRIVTV
ncbi:MAG: metallophosphoesterase family protein [Coriobacteriia bacterium]